MKIIVPMAGRGSRLRPHTLTIPKPLTPIAGKPVVQRLVEDIAQISGETIEEIAFIIGDFGEQTEKQLLNIAHSLGAKGHVFYQDEPLGTAHAILCAKDVLSGPVVVAFADTLFRADFKLNSDSDGVIWTKKVDDPSAFGVVKMDDKGVITDFVEKPQTFVSDEAIIGIYFFRDGANLRSELQYLVDNKITHKGEYSITDGLENMKNKGNVFTTGVVDEWMDCGNKAVVLETNSKVLGFVKESEALVHETVELTNSRIVPPCYIGEGVKLTNCSVGPFVSIGNNTVMTDVEVDNSMVMSNSVVQHIKLSDSMIGNNAQVDGRWNSLSVGDYTQMEYNA